MPHPKELALYLLLPAMELVSGYALLLSVDVLGSTKAGYGLFWLLLLAACLGAGVAILLSGWSWPERAERATLLGAGLLLAGAVASVVSKSGFGVVITTGLIGLAYGRGVVAASGEPDYDEVRRRYGLGFGLLFTGIVWVLVGHGSLHTFDWQVLSGVGILFVILSMVALALARLESQAPGSGGGAVSIALTLQLGLVAIVALGALQILSVDIVGGLFRVLQPLWNVLGFVLLPALRILLLPLFSFLAFLRAHPPAPQHATIRPPPVRPPGHRSSTAQHGGPALPVGLEIAVAALALAAILFLVWRVMPRLRRPAREHPQREERGTVAGAPGPWSAVLAWLRALLFGSSQAVVSGLTQLTDRIAGPPLPDDPVRRAYVRILRRARSAGLERPTWITPQEFQGRLAERWPQGADDFARLTKEYEARRYGEVHHEGEAVREIESLCARLQTVMRT